MRVLQVFNRYLERGGEEASVERVSDALSLRHKVFHCYFDSRQLPACDGVFETVSAAMTMVWNRDSAKRLREHARAAKPDFILLHNLFPVGTAALLSEIQKIGIPAISYIHNFRPFSVNGYLWANDRLETAGLKQNFLPEILAGSWQNSRVKTALYAAILTGMHRAHVFRHISHWIAISDFMREKFIEAGIPAHKVTTIRHSWEPMPCPPPADDQGYFLFLGRLITAKGVRVLFDAWRLIEADLGQETPNLLIAGDGPLRKEVEEECSSHKRVSYCGLVDGGEKRALISGCRAMLAPSVWWEGLGLVTFEAYDFAKPMLAAASGGLTETVVHGSTGLLHEPGNARQLADQVIGLSRSPDKASGMGRAGRAWLLANTHRDQWLDKFDKVFAMEALG